MTYFYLRSSFYQDKHSDKVSYHWIKTVPSGVTHGFTKIWPSDLDFDPKWPIGHGKIYWTYIYYHTKYEPNPSFDLENISHLKNFNINVDADADTDADGSA